MTGSSGRITTRLLAYFVIGYIVLVGGTTLLLLLAAGTALAVETRRTIVVIVVGGGLIGTLLVLAVARRMAAALTALADNTTITETAGRPSVAELDWLADAITRLKEENLNRVQAAQAAIETMETVLGALGQGTILFSADGAVLYANPAAAELLGAIPEALSGLAPYRFQTLVRESQEENTTLTRTVEHGRPARHLMGVATAFDDRVLLVVDDVTERERTAAVRRDFLANASHELKTPLATIISTSEALRLAVEEEDDATGFARQVEASARRLDRLVSDLLDLSRLEGEPPKMAPVRLDALVTHQVKEASPGAESKGLVFEVEASPLTVEGDSQVLGTAVRNLLDNAIRYTETGGKVRVVLSEEGGEAVLRVEDSGIGIPTKDLDRIFERFYRVDAARSRATGGTGLGLSIVRHAVESHGGTVEVESELGAGSTFTVRLPILD